jgi:ribonuclease D
VKPHPRQHAGGPAGHPQIRPITSTEALRELCERLGKADFVAVDTEFIRESTYWPILCLVQLAGPDEAALVDPLAPGLDLAPLLALMNDAPVLKVLHAGRQDIEILFHLTGRVPAPVFDTQLAAMVCGFGEQVSLDTLVTRFTSKRLDKLSRFTDWSVRPLSERQLRYALADVELLRPVYQGLSRQLAANDRAEWLAEETASLADPANYSVDPLTAWRRLKVRSSDPTFLNVLRAVTAYREREAQRRNLPRNRVIRDEALLEIAAHQPTSAAELARTRGLPRGVAEGRQAEDLLAVVRRGLDQPADEAPKHTERRALPPGLGPVVELLKVLLKLRCEEHGVAPKLVASTDDLDAIAASDSADVAALRGWRRHLFGEDALALKHGRLALAARGNRIVILPIVPGARRAGDQPAAASPAADS